MLTFVIPTAGYHEATVHNAVASCLAQTLTCKVIVVYDRAQRGAGWARNQGLAHVETPFVSFLDADDLLEPTFAERTLRAYDGRHYVYTDWHESERRAAPERAWVFQPDGHADNHHLITTLLPTAAARWIGGFDETLSGGEDGEFYIHLTRAGLCGKRLPEALVQYRSGGQRARDFIFGDTNTFGAGKDFRRVMQLLTERYKDMPMCCGQTETYDAPPIGDPQANDVLAKTLWNGNRMERGRATGRLYLRTGNGAQMWVDPKDVDAAPHLFSRVIELPPPPTDADFEALAAFARGNLHAPPRPAKAPDLTPAPVTVAPDVSRVLELYKSASPHS